VASRVVLSFDERIIGEVVIAKAVTVVGRHPDCDIVIEHPAVSGRHLLFRMIDRTLYVEDLASTNGTRVNGLAVSQCVVHHLDMIEVGRHRLHVIDDALVVGGVGGLEDTVLTDFERTMLAEHVPTPPPRSTARHDDDLSRTIAIQRNPTVRVGPAQERVETDTAVITAPRAPALALRVIRGERHGETLGLERANTMIGTAGGDTALVVKRGSAYFLARFSGGSPRLNQKELTSGTHPIGPRDVIDVGGSSFEVIQV
jgi:hypothetical protein